MRKQVEVFKVQTTLSFCFLLLSEVWPDDKVPSFQSEMASFFKICGELSLRILHLMAVGLQLKVEHFMSDTLNF